MLEYDSIETKPSVKENHTRTVLMLKYRFTLGCFDKLDHLGTVGHLEFLDQCQKHKTL